MDIVKVKEEVETINYNYVYQDQEQVQIKQEVIETNKYCNDEVETINYNYVYQDQGQVQIKQEVIETNKYCNDEVENLALLLEQFEEFVENDLGVKQETDLISVKPEFQEFKQEINEEYDCSDHSCTETESEDDETSHDSRDKLLYKNETKRRQLIYLDNTPALAYTCSQCDFNTDTSTDLRKHFFTAHKNHKFGSSNNEIYCYRKKIHICDVCDYSTYVKHDFNNHKRARHNELEYLNQHKKNHLQNVLYKCDMCDYSTDVKSYLRWHIKTHIEGKLNYKCDVCDYSSCSNTNLIRHKKTHIEQYKCEVCDHISHVKSDLLQHKKSHSVDELCYKCNVCIYKTYKKKDLKKHIRTHIFSCDLCKYQDWNQQKLQQHKLNHKLLTIKQDHDYGNKIISNYSSRKKQNLYKGKKKFKCDVCSYSTYKKEDFQKHIQTHLFSCDLCEYKDWDQHKLKSHKRNHEKLLRWDHDYDNTFMYMLFRRYQNYPSLIKCLDDKIKNTK